jgi:hypothetical protein
MARRRKKLGTPAKADSKLNLALKAGKSIKGLVGFVNIGGSDDEGNPVYAKVKCLGFTSMSEEDCSCSTEIKIRGEVIGTKSVITFVACNWLDTLAEVELDCDLNRRKALARNQYREMINHHYLARKRLAVQAYILDALKKDDQRAICEELAEKKLDLKTMDESKLKEYARTAALVANNIQPDEAEHWYD